MLTTDFKRIMGLIDLARHNISDIDSLILLLSIAAETKNFWRDDAGIEFKYLLKICEETKKDWHREGTSPWNAVNILNKLKTSDKVEDVIP